MASRMLVRASSLVSPWEWQPGRSRQLTDQPSSVSSKRILYDTAGSSFFLEPSQIQPQRCNNQRSSDRPMISPMPVFQIQDGRSAIQPLQPGRQLITPLLHCQHRQQQEDQGDADGKNEIAQHRPLSAERTVSRVQWDDTKARQSC